MPEYLKRSNVQAESPSSEVRETVSEVLLAIEREGEAAVRRYSQRFDGWSPPSFVLSEQDIDARIAAVDDELKAHIAFAQEQISTFARLQLESMHEFERETLPGVVLGQRHVPVAAVGSYSPGGRYPVLASSLMTILTPKVAGVDRVVAAAPPQPGGGIDALQLYAMTTSGADQILCIGGIQAVAALAFGLDGVEPVDMIVGAGNSYVVEAKRQLFGRVGIDLLAGPTEILVIADDSADPELIAADLLGQAEHGPTSPAVLVTTSRDIGEATIEAVDRWLETWPTAQVASQAWRDFGTVVVCDSREEAAATSDEFAPEHLEVQTRDPDWFLTRLRNYGTVFLGTEATVVYSDKAIGTNHVLPTAGAARYTGGLWVGKFLKTLTYQRVTPEGTSAVAPAAAAIAEAEGMAGHALTARIRLERLDKTV